jgi:hypothetical protein
LGTLLGAGLSLTFLKRPSRKPIPLLIYGLVFYFIWASTFRLPRFALGLWVIAAIVAAGGFGELLEKGKLAANLGRAVLSLALAASLTLVFLSGAREVGWNFFAKRSSAENYLTRIAPYQPVPLGAYPVLNWINHHSRPDDQVLLLGTVSFFYLERKAAASFFVAWNPLIIMFNLDKSPGEICQTLNEEPINYLVYQPAELSRVSGTFGVNRLTASGRERMEEFFQSPCLELVMRQDQPQVDLYRLKKMGLP